MQEFWMAPFIKSSNISPTFLLSTQMFLPLYRSFMDQGAPAPEEWVCTLKSNILKARVQTQPVILAFLLTVRLRTQKTLYLHSCVKPIFHDLRIFVAIFALFQ